MFNHVPQPFRMTNDTDAELEAMLADLKSYLAQRRESVSSDTLITRMSGC